MQTDANAMQAGSAWPKAIAIGRRALALLDAGRVPAPPVVGFRIDNTANETTTPRGRAPARDLRDARALLASIRALPPLLPGPLPHETP